MQKKLTAQYEKLKCFNKLLLIRQEEVWNTEDCMRKDMYEQEKVKNERTINDIEAISLPICGLQFYFFM